MLELAKESFNLLTCLPFRLRYNKDIKENSKDTARSVEPKSSGIRYRSLQVDESFSDDKRCEPIEKGGQWTSRSFEFVW